MGRDSKKKIGMSFQGGALFGSMTVGENRGPSLFESITRLEGLHDLKSCFALKTAAGRARGPLNTTRALAAQPAA